MYVCICVSYDVFDDYTAAIKQQLKSPWEMFLVPNWNSKICSSPFFLCMSFNFLFLHFWVIMVLQPPRTTCTVPFTCGAGAGPKLSGPTRRAERCALWFWLSCSGPTLRFPTWLSTPVLVGPSRLTKSSRMSFHRAVLSVNWARFCCSSGSVYLLCVSGFRLDAGILHFPVLRNRNNPVCSFLCSGQAYIVCGDDRGRLWTYHVTDLQKNTFQSGKPIQPTEVPTCSTCSLQLCCL